MDVLNTPVPDWSPGKVLHFISDERVERLEQEDSSNQPDWRAQLLLPIDDLLASSLHQNSTDDDSDPEFELPSSLKEQMDYHPVQLSHFHNISSSEDDEVICCENEHPP